MCCHLDQISLPQITICSLSFKGAEKREQRQGNGEAENCLFPPKRGNKQFILARGFSSESFFINKTSCEEGFSMGIVFKQIKQFGMIHPAEIGSNQVRKQAPGGLCRICFFDQRHFPGNLRLSRYYRTRSVYPV